MNQVIEVELRNVYGNNLMYPVNTTARIFAKMLGVKTFNRQQVQCMRDLGYTVGQVIGELSV
jgi:hypothetical protein